MAILFQDGFETLPFTGFVKVPPWTGTGVGGGCTITVEADPHHELYSARVTGLPGWAYAYKTLGAAVNEAYICGYVKFTNTPSLYIFCGVGWLNDAPQWAAWSTIDKPNNKWGVWNQRGAATYWEAGVSVINNGQWYCLELYCLRHATAGAVKLWVDSVLKVDQAGIDTGDDDLRRVCTGTYHSVGGHTCDVNLDCIVAADARIGCEVDFGGGLNPAQMAKAILGL